MHEKELQERFVAAYNAVDEMMRRRAGLERIKPRPSFPEVLQCYIRRYEVRETDGFLNAAHKVRQALGTSPEDFLRTMYFLSKANALRNIVVHETEEFAVPKEAMVARLEEIAAQMRSDEHVINLYRRKVRTLEHDAPLAEVLKLVRRHDFSQFPVYSGSRYIGLVTENGVTRWLAAAAAAGEAVSLEGVTVRQLLATQEDGARVWFVAPEACAEKVYLHFRTNRLLEVILITEGAKQTGAPLGIITRHDLAGR